MVRGFPLPNKFTKHFEIVKSAKKEVNRIGNTNARMFVWKGSKIMNLYLNNMSEKEEYIYHMDLEKSISWKTADTGESIPVHGSVRETFPVWLLCPDGKKIEEKCYRGDGKFGGQDVYALFANWNWPEECSGDAEKDAKLAHYKRWGQGCNEDLKIKYKIKLVRNPELNYWEVEESDYCEFDGWNYRIEDQPESCEELNKYSLDNVLAFYKEYMGGPLLITLKSYQPSKTHSGAIQQQLEHYGHRDNLIYVYDYKLEEENYYELKTLISEMNIADVFIELFYYRHGFSIVADDGYLENY